MKLSLVVVNAGKASGQTIPIKIPKFVIGRDADCNLRPASAMISKKHCAFMVKSGKVSLHDYDSTNGTFLNDEPVKGEVALKHDDVVKVGPLTFKIAIEASPAPSKPTPLPKAVNANTEEDDAAALLLSLEDGTIAPSTESSEGEVPGGSTVMDMPAFTPPGEQHAAKAEEKKKDEQPKHASASSAAAALFDKLRKGVRK
jgi:pSer/pThr/pTyr-binding forkhead associated (FHA) protein